MKSKIIAAVAVIAMFINTFAMCAFADEPAVWCNDTFENYDTGGIPSGRIDGAGSELIGMLYQNSPAEVIEDGPANKAIMMHPNNEDSRIWREIKNAPDDIVISFDIKLNEGSIKGFSIGVNSKTGGYFEPLVKVAGNNIYRGNGKEIGKILKSTEYYKISVVVKKYKYYDLYINNNRVVTNALIPKINFKNTAFMVIMKREADDKAFCLDNIRIYEGAQPRNDLKNQPYNNRKYDYINVNNDVGDYMYFDSTQCDNSTSNSKYIGFTTNVNDNSIVCNRLDHMNPNRENDYIIMTKSTKNQCYFDITMHKSQYIKDNSSRDSKRSFRYYLIEGSYLIKEMESGFYLPIVYDNQSAYDAYAEYAIEITPSGGMKFSDGTILPNAAKKDIWFSTKVFVDVVEHTMDIYVNDELVKENIPMSKKVQSVTLVRFQCPAGSGTAEVWIDKLKVTGLMNPYINGTVEKTDVFTDETAERAYLADKIAFHELNNLMYANGEKSKMSAQQIYENGELYIPVADAEKAFGKNITVNGSSIDYDGNSYAMTKGTKVQDDITYIPVMEFAEKAASKYVLHHEETGIIIISDTKATLNTEDWEYAWKRNYDKMTVLNDIDYLNNFLMLERPDKDKLLSDALKKSGDLASHPRIMLTAEDVTRLQGYLETDENYKTLFDKLIKYVEDEMKKPVVVYEYNDPLRMNIDEYTERIVALGMAWLLTEDQKYFDRCYEEIEVITEFPDYNLGTIHDPAEWCETLAIGYDWLYNGMTNEQRKEMGEKILNRCLKPLAEGLYGRIKGRQDSGDWGNFKWFTNMSTVSVAGVVAAAGAVAEIDYDYCMSVISEALKAFEYPIMQFSPAGGWIEGSNYWNYNGISASYVMLTLNSMFGEYYGLDKMRGFSETGEFIQALQGPMGVNPIGDTWGDNEYYQGAAMTMLGRVFDDKVLQNVRYRGILNGYTNVTGYDLMAYSGDISAETEVQYGTYSEGMEVYTIRKDMDLGSENMYFSTHFGSTTHYHSQPDCGTFILDMDGVRWAYDLGMDDYNLQNQLGYKQWQLYRYRAEGHNIMTVNPLSYPEYNGQNDAVHVPILGKAANEHGGYVYADMSDVYKDVNKMLLGYYVGDDMNSVTVRYETDLEKESELYWFMHTKADVYIKNNVAYLTDKATGKSIAVAFDAENCQAEMSVMEAKSLLPTLQISEQNQNTAYKKLAIQINGNSKVNLSVKITSLGKGVSPYDIMNTPISKWTLPETVENLNTSNLNFDVFVNGEKTSSRKLRAVDGIMPELTVKTEDPDAIVEIYEAENADDKTVIFIYDKNRNNFNIAIFEYYVPYIVEFNGYNDLKIQNVTASSVPQPQNGKDNMIDENISTRWTCMALEEYAVFDLGEETKIDGTAIAFWKGTDRTYQYKIQVSKDGENYTTVYEGASGKVAADSEYNIASFESQSARYVKYINYGNNSGAPLNGNVLEFRVLQEK